MNCELAFFGGYITAVIVCWATLVVRSRLTRDE